MWRVHRQQRGNNSVPAYVSAILQQKKAVFDSIIREYIASNVASIKNVMAQLITSSSLKQDIQHKQQIIAKFIQPLQAHFKAKLSHFSDREFEVFWQHFKKTLNSALLDKAEKAATDYEGLIRALKGDIKEKRSHHLELLPWMNSFQGVQRDYHTSQWSVKKIFGLILKGVAFFTLLRKVVGNFVFLIPASLGLGAAIHYGVHYFFQKTFQSILERILPHIEILPEEQTDNPCNFTVAIKRTKTPIPTAPPLPASGQSIHAWLKASGLQRSSLQTQPATSTASASPQIKAPPKEGTRNADGGFTIGKKSFYLQMIDESDLIKLGVSDPTDFISAINKAKNEGIHISSESNTPGVIYFPSSPSGFIGEIKPHGRSKERICLQAVDTDRGTILWASCLYKKGGKMPELKAAPTSEIAVDLRPAAPLARFAAALSPIHAAAEHGTSSAAPAAVAAAVAATSMVPATAGYA